MTKQFWVTLSRIFLRYALCISWYEPPHDKTKNVAVASAQSDQSVRLMGS